ncbi:MAG: ribosome-associated translation inhibitor RaiA [Ignavibacteriae bacterium]|nr:ribosome-associated translation inhibitor RaiA [Ignavibacteriota bacterium]
MQTTVTSRHFKAHQTLLDYAEREAEKLQRYYDGIVKCNIILKYEKTRNSDKIAEIIVSVYNARLAGVAHSTDFFGSVDAAVKKVTAQLKKYKAKLREKDKKTVRSVRAKAV